MQTVRIRWCSCALNGRMLWFKTFVVVLCWSWTGISFSMTTSVRLNIPTQWMNQWIARRKTPRVERWRVERTFIFLHPPTSLLHFNQKEVECTQQYGTSKSHDKGRDWTDNFTRFNILWWLIKLIREERDQTLQKEEINECSRSKPIISYSSLLFTHLFIIRLFQSTMMAAKVRRTTIGCIKAERHLDAVLSLDLPQTVPQLQVRCEKAEPLAHEKEESVITTIIQMATSLHDRSWNGNDRHGTLDVIYLLEKRVWLYKNQFSILWGREQHPASRGLSRWSIRMRSNLYIRKAKQKAWILLNDFSFRTWIHEFQNP